MLWLAGGGVAIEFLFMKTGFFVSTVYLGGFYAFLSDS